MYVADYINRLPKRTHDHRWYDGPVSGRRRSGALIFVTGGLYASGIMP